MTPTAYKIYNFIKDYLDKHPYAPNTTEIAQGIGLKSRGVIPRYLKQLEDAGLITRTAGKHRNISLTETKKNIEKSARTPAAANETAREQTNFTPPPSYQPPLTINLVGSIAAGRPIEAILDNQQMDLSDLFLKDDHYALRVKGDSMIEEGIFDGDIVVCQYTQSAENGTIVVAIIDEEEATLKRIKHDPMTNHVTLIPANPNLKPKQYEAHRVRIQGRYLGLLRLDGLSKL
jgi:repressor LexA